MDKNKNLYMKQIEFRCWNVDENRMDIPSMLDFINSGYWVQTGQSSEHGFWVYPPEEFILLRFTGLYDKNGKEIYEGDIVKTYHNFILIVAFEYGAFVLKNKQDTHCAVLGWQSDYESNEMDWADLDDIEVIGNIYENKELLNE